MVEPSTKKYCPKCRIKYADESLLFCLEDGALYKIRQRRWRLSYSYSLGKFAGTTFEVSGCINKIYARLGDAKSWLDFPIKDGYPDPPGARRDFEGGYILWGSKTCECRANKN